MASRCFLTNESCALEPYGKGPCSDKPDIVHAAACISQLREMTLDLEKEVAAQDDILEKVRESNRISDS